MVPTRNLIGAEQLAMMRRNAILINTARGGLVDEGALAQALQDGIIGGAGFDVLTNEPPTAGNVLLNLDLPNFIVTPHDRLGFVTKPKLRRYDVSIYGDIPQSGTEQARSVGKFVVGKRRSEQF